MLRRRRQGWPRRGPHHLGQWPQPQPRIPRGRRQRLDLRPAGGLDGQGQRDQEGEKAHIEGIPEEAPCARYVIPSGNGPHSAMLMTPITTTFMTSVRPFSPKDPLPGAFIGAAILQRFLAKMGGHLSFLINHDITRTPASNRSARARASRPADDCCISQFVPEVVQTMNSPRK